jgi:hypothetical protein
MFVVKGKYKDSIIKVRWDVDGILVAEQVRPDYFRLSDSLLQELEDLSEQGTYGNVQTKFFKGKNVLKSALGTWLFLSDTLEDMKLVEGEQPLWPDIPNGAVA